jgi:Na+/serine symporter
MIVEVYDEEKIKELKNTIAENKKFLFEEFIHLIITIIGIAYMIAFIGIAPVIAIFHYTKSPFLISIVLGGWYGITYFFIFDKEITNNKVFGYFSQHLIFWKEYFSAQASLKKEIKYLRAYKNMDTQERIRYWIKH